MMIGALALSACFQEIIRHHASITSAWFRGLILSTTGRNASMLCSYLYTLLKPLKDALKQGC